MLTTRTQPIPKPVTVHYVAWCNTDLRAYIASDLRKCERPQRIDAEPQPSLINPSLPSHFSGL